MEIKEKYVVIPPDPRYDYSTEKHVYKLIDQDINFCCSEMKDNYDDYISINEYNGKLCLKFDESWSDYPDWTDFDYCPWCGEKITIDVVEKVKIVKEFEKKTIKKEVCEYVGSREEPLFD